MELTNDFRVGLPIDQAWAVLTDLERIAPCMPGAQLQEVEGEDYRGVVKVKVGPITAQYKGQASFLDRDAANHVAVLRAEGRETRGQGNASAIITATLVPDGDGTAVSILTDLTITGRVAQFGRGVLADVSAKLLEQFVESLETTVLADGAAAAPASDEPPAEEPAAEEPSAAEESVTEEPSAAAPASDEPAAEESAVEEPSDAAPAAKEPAAEQAAAEPPAAEPPAAAAGPRRIDHPEPEPVDLVGTAGAPVAKRVAPILILVAIVWLLKKLFGRSRD